MSSALRRGHSVSGVFDQQCDALPAADAGRGDAAAQSGAAQLARQRDGEADASRRKRMPDRDRAAIHVQFRLVERKLARARHHLRAERLVDFDPVDVAERDASARQQSADRRHRADAHDLRRTADGDAGDDPRQRFLSRCRRIAAGADEAGGGAMRTTAELLPAVCTPPNTGRSFSSVVTGDGRTWVSARTASVLRSSLMPRGWRTFAFERSQW